MPSLSRGAKAAQVMLTMLERRIEIAELGPGKFSLSVVIDGRRFDCGSYLSRAAAQQAARLLIARKEGEAAGRRKSSRKK